MKSHYESVINQAGIRAGGEGFDISVKDNTDLKGGVIGSDASKDKNTLTTGTLSWEDKENKADYKAGGMGVSYSPNDKSSKLNQRGLTPNLTPTVKDNADSTTKSAVAEGTIHITNKEKQKQDIASLNRDTKNSLNQLQEIFDKTKVEERQELVGMLEKYGNQAIHTYAESKGWKDGSTEKMLLHGAFGALMGDMAGGSAATGALSGSINEYVMGYLTKTKGEDWMQKYPDTVQWISMGVASTLGKLANGSVSEVADIALAGTKWNYYGSRKDEKGNISGMGKIAALLQPDGTYQYVTNVNGTDIPINREDLYKYTSVWIEDPKSPGMGYTYIINGDDGDTYYSGTFKDERFDKQNRSMIYLGVDNWNEMESIIPGFSKTDKVGDKIFPELSKVDELKAYSWSKSLASNALSEKANMVPNELVKQNWGGPLFKYFTKAGGAIGVPLTLSDMMDDWNNYSGYRLWLAWGSDGLPLFGGIAAGKPFGIIGAVGGAMAGDRAKDGIKDKIPTDQDIQLTKGSSKGK
ncbi:hemagglutinin/hemolysin-related protein [Dialister sp. CAG:486]|nr:hemagglutinin/hemolysin-related protein [Dialister sp. CAG:486]